MRVIKGKEGCSHTWQDEFPEDITCGCLGTAHIAFVAIEEGGVKSEDEEGGFVCNNRPEDAEMWPHDAIAVAVYICRLCMKPTSRMNQG